MQEITSELEHKGTYQELCRDQSKYWKEILKLISLNVSGEYRILNQYIWRKENLCRN